MISAAIRQAREDDLPALEWEGEYAHFRRAYRYALEEARKGRRMLLVAEADGGIIGQLFVQLGIRSAKGRGDGPAAYLYAFRVKPRYQNQGIGTNLLLEAERRCSSIGFERLLISVSKSNPQARRLYERLGFEYVADDPGRWSYIDHEGNPRSIHDPSLIFEKQLP